MLHFTKLLFGILILLRLGNSLEIVSTDTRVVTLDTSRYAIFKYDKSYSYYIPNGKAATLSISEINFVETLLKEAVLDYNASKKKLFSGQPISTLEDYKFQLVPALDSTNKKVVFANCIKLYTAYGRLGIFKNQPDDWKTVFVYADGGGNSIFHLTLSLTDSTYTHLITNGPK